MTLLQELQDTIAGIAERVGPVGRRARPRLGPRVRASIVAPGRVTHERARAARRGGRRRVPRRRHAGSAAWPAPTSTSTSRSSRSTRATRRRRVGAGPARAARASARRYSRSRTRAGAGCASRSARCPRPSGRSAVRAGGGSAARSSTRRRCRAARRAARSSTPTAGCSASTPFAMDGGLILALPADAALQRRVEALAAGEAEARPRLGVALAPARAARRMRSAVGLPERDGLLVRAVVDDSPAATAGHRARRPAGRRGRRTAAWRGRPLRRARSGRRRRWR